MASISECMKDKFLRYLVTMVLVKLQLLKCWLECFLQVKVKHTFTVTKCLVRTWIRLEDTWECAHNTTCCLTCWTLLKRWKFFKNSRAPKVLEYRNRRRSKNLSRMLVCGTLDTLRAGIFREATKENWVSRSHCAASRALLCLMNLLREWIYKLDVICGICYVHTEMIESLFSLLIIWTKPTF